MLVSVCVGRSSCVCVFYPANVVHSGKGSLTLWRPAAVFFTGESDANRGCADELREAACAAAARDCVEATAAAGDCTACGEERYTRTAEPTPGGAACVGSSTLCADGDGAASCAPPASAANKVQACASSPCQHGGRCADDTTDAQLPAGTYQCT